jgi:hypothetical protein
LEIFCIFDTMIRYTTETLQRIKADSQLRYKLIGSLNVTERQLLNCLDTNSKRLTELDSVNEIVGHLNRPLSELIEGGKVSKLLAK